MITVDWERRAKRERLREILQPSPVEQGKFPRWFRLRRGDKLPRVFDHWGRAMTRGGIYALVTEPYFTAMCEERWEEVRRFAIKYDLEYMVVPNSYHEPGDTLRILFGHEEWCPDLMPCCPPKDKAETLPG
jgi:hypothetical protein